MKKLFLSMAGLSAVSYAVSLLNQLLVSYFFGTSYQVDAYWLSMYALQIALFYIGPAKEAFVPGFHKKISNDPYAGDIYFSQNFNLLMIIVFCVFLLILFFPDSLAQFVVSDNQSVLAAELVRVLVMMTPLMFLLFISEMLNGVLIALNLVLVQNIGKIISIAAIAVFVIFLSKRFGIFAIVFGSIVGQFAVVCFQGYKLKQKNFRYIPFTKPGIDRNFRTMSGALIMAHAFAQFYLLFEKNTLTAFGEGVVSAYQYGFTLSQVPQMMLITSMSVVLWPKILDAIHGEGLHLVWPHVIDSFKLLSITLGFITVFCTLFSEHLVYFLFYRGAFDMQSLSLTSMSFKITALALVPAGFYVIIGRILLSLGQSKALVMISIGNTVAGISVLLIARLFEDLEIALCHIVVAAMVNFGISLWYLRRSMGKTRGVLFNIKSTSWGLRFSIVLCGFMLLYPVPKLTQISKLEVLAQISVNLAVIGVMYCGLLFISRNLKVYDVRRFFNLSGK